MILSFQKVQEYNSLLGGNENETGLCKQRSNYNP